MFFTSCAEKDPDVLVVSARDYLAQGNPNAAMIQLRNALQLVPENGALRLMLGSVLLEVHDPAAASRELRKASQYGETQDSVLPLLARAIFEQGDSKQLVSEFGPQRGVAALSSPQSEAAFKAVLGQAQLQMAHTADAALSFRAAELAVPGYIPAQVGLARVLAIEGDRPAATRAAARLIAAHPESPEAHMLVADLHALDANDGASIVALEHAVSADGGHLPARYALIATLIGEQRFDAAITHLEQARKQAKHDLRIDYFDAVIALGKDDLQRARESSQRILKYSPEHVPSLVLAAAVELRARQPAAAETHLRAALALAPQHAGARRMLVRAYLISNLPAKALEALQPLLIADNASDPTLAMLAGEAFLANGDVREAANYYTAAAESAATKPVAQTRLGQIAMAAGDTQAGLKQLEQVAAADDAPIQADLALIAGYLRGDQLDRALQAAQRFVKKQPNRPLPFQLLGSVYAAKNDSLSARAQFLKALEVSSTYLPAVAGLASLDISAGEPAEAQRRFDAIVAKEPNNEQALLGLADVMIKTGAQASVITETLQRANRVNPQLSDARVALIMHHLRVEQASLALAAAQEAAAALPNDPRILYALAQSQEADGQTQQAIQTFNRLATLEPQSKLLTARLAEEALRAGNMRSAMALYRSVVKQEPENYVALNNLAWAAGEVGDPKAVEYAQRAVKIAPEDAATLDTLGSLLVARGDIEHGVGYLRKARELAPKRSDIRLNYAKALIKAGRKSVARSELEYLRSAAEDPAGKAEIATILKGL